MWRFLNLVLYFCIRKSYPNKQSDADHGNWNGCQLVTQKQGNSSNSLEFKEIYSYCRIMQYICNTQMAKQGIFQENEEKNADFYVIKHISHKHFVSLLSEVTKRV